MKLWGGRFSGEQDQLTDDFNSSISFDARLYKHDIEGSISHAAMLGKQKIISFEDSLLIQQTLKEILLDIENGKIEFKIDAEDIHMNIESILTERIGDVGKRLHTGRSRNDQVALDIRMYLKNEVKIIKDMILSLEGILLRLSEENLDTIMPGYTHLQRAQPISFAHHIMAYFQMFRRDIERLDDCYKRIDVMPLGAGALAGTTYPLDREFVKDSLNFGTITENSLDAVSDRDFVIELASCLAIFMMHTSRFCEELILWSSHEFSFVEMDDAFSTGSSIMPQKKNPDVAELVRGKTGRVYGSLITLLTVMKGLPLAYNKDMQEDKEAIFDALDTVKMCVPVFSKMLATMKLRKDNMLKACHGGFVNATDAADYLVKKGLPFRDAHEVIGKLVAYCIEVNKTLDELTIVEYGKFSSIFEPDIYDAINLETCVNSRSVYGGSSRTAVITAIRNGYEFIGLF